MLGFFPFVLSFTSGIFNLQSPDRSLRQKLLGADVAHVENAEVASDWEWVAPMRAAPPYDSFQIASRKDWIVTCDNEGDVGHECQKVIDGDKKTHWLTNAKSSSQANTITIDMGITRNINGVAMLPRQDDTVVGNIATHEIYLSSDGKKWTAPVAYGTWYRDHTEKRSNFEPVPARFVRLVALSDAASTSTTAIAELDVYHNPSYAGVRAAGAEGIWGPTIDTPIVPVSAFVDPLTGKVMMLSSKRHDSFPQDSPAYTITSIWDPADRSTSQAQVKHTNHNMFCPGMTFDAEGRMIVTGGATAKKTTIYNGAENDTEPWSKGAQMNIPRGYQSSVLMADGTMFVLGGSWGARALTDPATITKNGELYNPKTDEWSELPLCLVEKAYTNDLKDDKRDDHMWLFSWKNDTVFQAGPSKQMNWYTVTGEGGWSVANNRTPSDNIPDDDAMCGEAVMYDAVGGHIATFGGADWYDSGGPASNDAFVLTIGDPNSTVNVARVEKMAHKRTFASAIVVPNGDVFVSGGQHGVPEVFVDRNPVLQAESFSPITGRWTQLANNSIVRVYHSWTVLLPDATIINGGGGLCGDQCEANHFDFQLYTPPYLLTADGELAPRPAITTTSSKVVELGQTVTIETDKDVDTASLIRYGSTTHSVNTDQRRIPLQLRKVGKKRYQFTIPDEGYVAIPGYWMLFVMDAQGVPSVAETIKILVG